MTVYSAIAISHSKSKFARYLLNYSLRDQNIPEANFCKYLRIITRSDLSWAEQIDYMVQKAWKEHFIMCIVKNAKSLAYASLIRPILKYGATCWDPCRKCEISALDRVQNKAAKFAHYIGDLPGKFLLSVDDSTDVYTLQSA
jgi:hypothetical protein